MIISFIDTKRTIKTEKRAPAGERNPEGLGSELRRNTNEGDSRPLPVETFAGKLPEYGGTLVALVVGNDSERPRCTHKRKNINMTPVRSPRPS